MNAALTSTKFGKGVVRGCWDGMVMEVQLTCRRRPTLLLQPGCESQRGKGRLRRPCDKGAVGGSGSVESGISQESKVAATRYRGWMDGIEPSQSEERLMYRAARDSSGQVEGQCQEGTGVRSFSDLSLFSLSVRKGDRFPLELPVTVAPGWTEAIKVQ